MSFHKHFAYQLRLIFLGLFVVAGTFAAKAATEIEGALEKVDPFTGIGDYGDITILIGQYAHGNESSHHIVYLFNWAGQPWRTQELLYKIMTEFYPAAPGGLIGNEDCGQMSAWFILSAMGIYQVTPGDVRFAIGRPLFPEARVNLPGGKAFVVRMKNGGLTHPYVQRVSLNGKAWVSPFITCAEIMTGGELVFEMGAKKMAFWYAQ